MSFMADYLRDAREAAGLTPQEAEQRTHIYSRRIEDFELDRRRPSYQVLLSLCTGYGIYRNELDHMMSEYSDEELWSTEGSVAVENKESEDEDEAIDS